MKVVKGEKIYTLKEAKESKELVRVVSDKEYETLQEDKVIQINKYGRMYIAK